jgi:hypothetical protein
MREDVPMDVHPQTGESEHQRWIRNFSELLQELRVAQTGVQFLFAFLLGLAFTQRFGETTQTQRIVYVITLVITTVSAVLLIAPVSYHRIVFRRNMKPTLVRHSHRMALGGLLALGLAVVFAVFLIVDVVFGTLVGALVAAGIAAWFVVFWYLIPWFNRGELAQRQKDY